MVRHPDHCPREITRSCILCAIKNRKARHTKCFFLKAGCESSPPSRSRTDSQSASVSRVSKSRNRSMSRTDKKYNALAINITMTQSTLFLVSLAVEYRSSHRFSSQKQFSLPLPRHPIENKPLNRGGFLVFSDADTRPSSRGGACRF
ncbi:MAG: hypothetical protein RL235_237 [Chlamydiota bacterium]|jgi:hypothetical protein